MLENVYFEGQIVPQAEAKITIGAHTIQYGTGIFSGIRGYFVSEGVIRLFRPQDHFQRMMDAAKIFDMDFRMSFEDFRDALEDLVRTNRPQTGIYFRPLIYSDDEILTPCFDKLNYKMAIYVIELGDYLDTTRGLKLMISGFKKFADGAISTKAKATGAYLHASAARTEANRLGFDEALVMDDNGNLVEASAANMMIVRRGEVFMPPIGAAMLEGITMRTVCEILADSGVKVRFEPIDRSMVYTADEILLTGTGAQVVFAESIDGRKIGDGSPGPICTLLRQAYEDLIAIKHKLSQDWILEINF